MSLLEVIIYGLVFLIPIYIIEMNMGNQIILGKPFYLILAYVVIFPGLAAFLFWIKGISIIEQQSVNFSPFDANYGRNNGNDNL